jgi:hypothetical protein
VVYSLQALLLKLLNYEGPAYGRVINTPISYSGDPRFKSRFEHRVSWPMSSVISPRPSRQMPTYYLKLRHDHFLPHTLKFTTHKTFFHSMLYSLSYFKSKAVPLYAMEALGGRGDIAPRWGWVVSITPRPRFTPGTHCTGGWVGPRAGLDTDVRGKILCPRRGSKPDRPVVQPVVRHYTDWANPAPLSYFKSVVK